MSDGDTGAMTDAARQLVAAARAELRLGTTKTLALNHWLLALLARHGPMAESLVLDLDSAALRPYLRRTVSSGDTGPATDEATVLARARLRAAARQRDVVSEQDIAATILEFAGYRSAPALGGSTTAGGAGAAGGAPPGISTGGSTSSDENPGATGPATPTVPGAGSAGAAIPWQPRTVRPTPVLEQYGRDLTRHAFEGKLTPIVGREAEIELVIETLCRRTKRNPVLVGPAGTGKTAIVEGLAQRIVRAEVPAVLRNARVVQLQPSSLVAGAGVVGELENRMRQILAEANQDGLFVFIDEVHSIVGAGGARGSGDIASLLKPALARGDIACIAATTDDEYRQYVEADGALERRFNPVRVHELTATQTLEVVRVLRDDLERLRGVRVSDDILSWLVEFAGSSMPNRRFPDKAVDLLEQCVASAVAHEVPEVSRADADTVIRRMVGMPLSVTERIAMLSKELSRLGLLRPVEVAALSTRLEVTMRGLDVRPPRPNAVLFLAGEAAERAAELARALSDALFGAPDRVVPLDFGRMTEGHDVAMLVGAPPGYIGYSDSLPIHRVAQMPWCVLLCESVDRAHPSVRDVLAAALADGYLVDGAGRRVFLSDAVVLLTAAEEGSGSRPIGFAPPVANGEEPAPADGDRTPSGTTVRVEPSLGAGLAAQVDLVCAGGREDGGGLEAWVAAVLLPDLALRFVERGVEVTWDSAVVGWLARQANAAVAGHVAGTSVERRLERVVDETIAPGLVREAEAAGTTAAGTRLKLWVRMDGDRVIVERTAGPLEVVSERAARSDGAAGAGGG